MKGEKNPYTPEIIIDLERPVDLVALSVGPSAVRCRLLDADQTVTVRLIPATLRPDRSR